MDEKEKGIPDRGALPLGLMMALAQDMRAMERFAYLSPEEQQSVIDRAANTHSRTQMQMLVAGIGMDGQKE